MLPFISKQTANASSRMSPVECTGLAFLPSASDRSTNSNSSKATDLDSDMHGAVAMFWDATKVGMFLCFDMPGEFGICKYNCRQSVAFYTHHLPKLRSRCNAKCCT